MPKSVPCFGFLCPRNSMRNYLCAICGYKKLSCRGSLLAQTRRIRLQTNSLFAWCEVTMAVGPASGKKWGPSSSSSFMKQVGKRVGSIQGTKRWAEWVIGIISPLFVSLAICIFAKALFRSICILDFCKEIFNIWSIKCRLITKLITDLVCKLRNEFNENN